MYQQFQARHTQVEAMLVAPVVDGQPTAERHYVVDGVGVIDAATFATFFVPSAHPAVIETNLAIGATKAAVSETKPAPVETQGKRKSPPKEVAPPAPRISAEKTAKREKEITGRKYTYVSDAIRTAVREIGGTADEIYDLVLTMGFPAASDKTVRELLYQLWQKNEVERDEMKRYYMKPAQSVADHA